MRSQGATKRLGSEYFDRDVRSQGATNAQPRGSQEQPNLEGRNLWIADSAARQQTRSSQCATKEQPGSNQTFRVRSFRSRIPQPGTPLQQLHSHPNPYTTTPPSSVFC